MCHHTPRFRPFPTAPRRPEVPEPRSTPVRSPTPLAPLFDGEEADPFQRPEVQQRPL